MLQPLRGKLIVENIPDASQTESGLWLAKTVKEVAHRGRIIAIGAPYMDRKGRVYPWDIQLGEVVHFKRKWTEFKETHYCLLRDDVFAVERKNAPCGVRDLVIVKRVYTGDIGNSTIVIPKTYGVEENYEDYYGLAIHVGSEDKFGISPGDRIYYHRNEGLEVKMPNGDIFWSLKARAIMARLEA